MQVCELLGSTTIEKVGTTLSLLSLEPTMWEPTAFTNVKNTKASLNRIVFVVNRLQP